MKIRFFLLFFLVAQGFSLSADNLNIRIYSEKKIDRIEIVPSFGIYELSLDGEHSMDVKRRDIIKIDRAGSKVRLSINDSSIGSFSKIELNKLALKSFFQINPLDKSTPRRYDDNLHISSKHNQLFLINNIDMENYIAGVVQAETWGATTNVEFFKVQAICVRNYIVKNMNKHSRDGFQLCDQVHCQAYKGRANQDEIIQGAYNSKGEIIVNEEDEIIETLFHANSGGETVNSEDVWSRPFSHLVGKIDSFSVDQKAYRWERFIKQREWGWYFKGNGVDIKNDSVKHELINFSQEEGRKKEMLGIPLVQIRKDFNLRSTFFSCQEWGSEVKLVGRGYGHGVGMSQEGAIKMCDEGYEYWQVIEFYYTGARIKRIEDINL